MTERLYIRDLAYTFLQRVEFDLHLWFRGREEFTEVTVDVRMINSGSCHLIFCAKTPEGGVKAARISFRTERSGNGQMAVRAFDSPSLAAFSKRIALHYPFKNTTRVEVNYGHGLVYSINGQTIFQIADTAITHAKSYFKGDHVILNHPQQPLM